MPIEQVTVQHKLWDGENWVHHDGVVYKGEKEVITYGGLTATKDHLVWIEGQSRPVRFGFAAASGAHLVQTEYGGKAVRIPDSVTEIGNGAFEGCSSLTNIIIPDSVTVMGDDLFENCDTINLTLTVSSGSYAEQYAKEHDLKYTYPDANDWMTN